MEKTILLIEDDQILLRMYTKKFESTGYQVFAAGDGEEGLKMLEQANPKPSMILSDIMLPQINGFEVLEKVKQNPTTKDIPVILLTNLGGGEQDRAKGESLGAVDYLVKSETTPTQIVEKVNKLLGVQ